MKGMKRYWFLGVVVIMALLFAGMTFAKDRSKAPSKADFQAQFQSKIASTKGLPKLDMNDFKGNLDNFNRPAYKDIRRMLKAKSGTPTPESLCDDGYYWMGGPAWTADTDGTSMVWGAGGNLYFASAQDPTHPLEMWWGDIPLRVRIHNGIALVFCYFYTYSFDVSDPLNPGFMAYGPGYSYGFIDAYSSPDDSYWILTDWAYTEGLTVFDPVTGTYTWGPIPNPNGGWYLDAFIDDEQKVLIAGDWSNMTFDFWDISDLTCSAPTFIGQIDDSPNWGNTGNVFYKDEYLYGNYEPWQWYNSWLFGGGPDGEAWVSVYHVPDLHNPDNNYYVKQYYDNQYDIVSMKKADDNILIVNYQNRAGLWTDQFETHLKSAFFGTTAGYVTYDGGYNNGMGVAACEQGGARFFADATGGTFADAGVYWTGGFAADVIPNGNYLFVPSGYAGLGIIDNTDPTYPVTYSYIWDFTGNGIWYAAVSPDGNTVYVSDGSNAVWTIDVTDKLHPAVVSESHPYTTFTGALVQRLTMLGDILVVGTGDSIDLVGGGSLIANNPILGGATMVKSFDHPAYPDQLFLAVTSGGGTLYTFYFDGTSLSDSGSLALGVGGLYDVVTVGQIAYVAGMTATIYPVKMISLSPNIYFDLNRTGVTDLAVGYTAWGSYSPFDYVRMAQVNAQYIAVYGDNTVYGYPAVFLVDVGTNPLVPALAPATQPGLMPFDSLTGLNSSGNYVYYATDWFGTGALSLKPDYDMPTIVAGPTATPATADAVAGHNPNPTYWIQGTVKLSVTVSDPTTAIKQVVFKFNDGSSWRTIKKLTTSTPAGQDGVYSFDWDTTSWIYPGTGPSPIRVEVTDSGCNTLIYTTGDTYAINMPPTYDIVWDPGCNEPPAGGICGTAGAWVVCDKLCFTIQGLVRDDAATYHNEVPTTAAPIDDVSQIAYKIDDGSWVLYPVPIALADGNANPEWDQYICIDTAGLSDGSHTLSVRVADDCGLHGYKDINGQSSWTFTVYNDGPQPYITAPMAGDIVRGSAIRVAAQMHNEVSARPVKIVKFYLDPTDVNDPTSGTLIGSATTKDAQGEYSFTWDASSVPYGDHILASLTWLDSSCCAGPFKSPIVSFNLVQYVAMTVTATGAPTTGNAPLAVVFTAAVTGGQAEYTYAWDFGDGQTGTGNVVSHSYTTAGSYTAKVTVTDNTGATAQATVAITVTGPVVENPVITGVKKATSPFRLHIYGSKFKPGCDVYIGTTKVTTTAYKDSTHVVAKKGASLKALCPKGVQVMITVKNPDGGVSNEFPYTR